MASKAPTYTVACCTPDCHWEEDCYSYTQARQTAWQHKRTHRTHSTSVFMADVLRHSPYGTGNVTPS
jgi:hypothetical protein